MEELADRTKILNAQQVSERFRVSLSTVHHLTRMGKLRAIKNGKMWVYQEEDIENYLAGGYAADRRRAERRQGERRRFRRVNCFIQAKAVGRDSNDTWEGDGTILNMCEGGLLFELHGRTAAGIHPETPVIVSLYFPTLGHLPEMRLRGKVIYFHELPKRRFGVGFQNLDPDTQRAIQEYLQA